ncbi:transporter substrate-binding domain-containing protein [Rhodobacterales bacterium HKCCE2091]|nr:transporter substrate-binding domain-containing protein [Rhodobacterales bacterium HKCCE2091]
MPLRRHLLAALAAAVMLPAAAFARCENYTPQPRPQNVGRDIVGQSLDTIVERGFMTFALYADLPPWSWQEDGEPRGVDVEIARIIAETIGVEPRFNFVAAAETLEADLRYQVWQGPVVDGAVSNVMMHVPYDSEFTCRVEQVAFTGQAYTERLAIAYREEAYPDTAPTAPFFRFDRIGVENDTIADFYMSSFAGGQMRENVVRFPDVQDAMAAMRDGEINAVMGPRGQLEHGTGEGIAVHTPPMAGLAVGDWTVGLAVHFAWRPLGYAVDDAVWAALDDGRIEAIFERHGLTFEPPER